MFYTIRFDFDTGGEPPTVLIVDGEGTDVIEVFEEPISKTAVWSRAAEDWIPGPLATRVLDLLNAADEAENSRP